MTFSPRRKSITHGRNTSSRRYSRPLHASRKTRGEIAPSKRNRCESVDSSSVVGPAFTSQSDPLRRKGAFAKKISRARNFRNDGRVIAFLSNPRDWKGGDLETTKTTLCYNSHFSPIFLYYSYLFSIYFHQFFSHFPFTIYHNYPRYYKIYIYKITPASLRNIHPFHPSAEHRNSVEKILGR